MTLYGLRNKKTGKLLAVEFEVITGGRYNEIEGFEYEFCGDYNDDSDSCIHPWLVTDRKFVDNQLDTENYPLRNGDKMWPYLGFRVNMEDYEFFEVEI